MGLLVDGVWHVKDPRNGAQGDRFERPDATFRNWITVDGSPGPSGEGGFPAAAGRYHLYVSLACPWAHRTLILRALKGLEGMISLSIVDPLMGDDGWVFSDGPGCIPDTVNGKERLWEVYRLADPRFSGRVTVPVLWDQERRTIVSNESSEIIVMMNGAFDHLGARPVDFYPTPLRAEIDALDEWIYEDVNNGVYKAGFARTQEAYEAAFDALFAALDRLDERLATRRYLAGPRVTLADWRLFTTLVRFDPVYVGHFKCNLRRIADYPALCGYLRDLYQFPGVRGAVDVGHIKRHYHLSHRGLDPRGIVPKGPALDLDAPHRRERVGILKSSSA